MRKYRINAYFEQGEKMVQIRSKSQCMIFPASDLRWLQPIRSRWWFWRGLRWLESNGSFIRFLKTLNYYLWAESSLLRCFQITDQFYGFWWSDMKPLYSKFKILITRSFSRISKIKNGVNWASNELIYITKWIVSH